MLLLRDPLEALCTTPLTDAEGGVPEGHTQNPERARPIDRMGAAGVQQRRVVLHKCGHKGYNMNGVKMIATGGPAMKVRTTGVREAKAQFSRLLRDAQRGREWIITDHGKPVARLVPPSTERLPMEERLRRLEEMGLLDPPRGHARDLPPPLPFKDGLAQRWLREGREAR